MANQSLNGVLQHLRKLAAVQTHRALPDRELLERFANARDEAAFTVLIERHGSMVLGVCRRALPNLQDAEDACQATFLVLARKAASIRNKTSLASWLHGVARRAAARLKRDYARRKSREHGAVAREERDPAAEVSWREVQAILDEELDRLPERYRAPVILCYLECMTRDEAAKQMGLSSGSLHRRLERARGLLGQRLARRGLTLAAVVSAAALGEGVAEAALSPTLVVSSTRAALLLTAGQAPSESVVATHVLALTQEVVKSMFLTKLKTGSAALLSACLLVAMIGGFLTSTSIAQDTDPPQRGRAGKTESDADFIRRISKDLRGADPTPAEVHFFITSTDAARRQKLIDLFIQERQAKQSASAPDKGGEQGVKYADVVREEFRKALEKDPKAWSVRQRQNPPVLHGVVKDVSAKDSGLLSISIGSNNGLLRGHVLEVFRLEPKPEYLGQISIIEVSPDQAVGKRLRSPTKMPDLKVGDRVAPLIKPTAEKK